MRRVFVTGGSGFVGRNLIRALVERGVEVVGLARSERAAQAVTAAGGRAVQGDLDTPRLADAMSDCEVVFHAAARVGDFGPEAAFLVANVGGTQNVLNAARAAGVPRVVHVSTEAVLAGERPIVQADETWPYPKRPTGPYPRTKGEAERVVLGANRPGLETVVIRPRFIWGGDDTVLLPRLIEAVERAAFAWFDGGRYATSTCHVVNCCKGLLLGAEHGRGGEVYFVTDGEPVEFRDFVTRLLATQGVTPPDRELPRWLARVVARVSEGLWSTLPLPGQPPLTRTAVRLVGEEVTVVDAKARRELGYRERVSVEAGLADLSARARPEASARE